MDKNNQIAVMLLVNSNENQVNRLIRHLSEDFDIYVHIDKRSSIKINELKNVYVYKEYKTYHSSCNQTVATLFLLEKAFLKGYNRYLLISGQDLPIKSNKEIKSFFENNNKEYIDINKIPRSDGWPDNMNGLTKYNFYKIYIGNNSNIAKKLYEVIQTWFRKFSKIKPRKIDYDFYGGSNWTNYTHTCVKKIFEWLENNKKYIDRFKWTNSSDEIFYQTIINQLDGIFIENDCLRYIDWQTGPEFPRTLRVEDYEKVINSNYLFARKFDEKADNRIIEMIYKKIENEKY
ncbi:MAG: beta-1,6-N-acetylglucosaminyltransferase [Spirochaetaceae bacterium]|nr:beta-1,6-N-acetylglucosaminyltransferase [Spirochaetaceae bacterium]